MMSKPKYNHPFIKFVRQECKRYGVKFILLQDKYIKANDYDDSCGGYFTEEPPELAVATRVWYTDFLSTLVHEYSHMLQWVEESPFRSGYRGLDSWDIVERWINGETFKKTTVKKCIDSVRDCELDCDRRAVEIIKKHKLPINVGKYCQKASSYAYLHNYIKLSRQWEYDDYPDKNERHILKLMPTNLDSNYSRTPRKIMNAFKKYMV